MKYVARIFLFLFVTFLVTPTLIKLIKKKLDNSEIFKSLEEETTQKEVKIYTSENLIVVNFYIINQFKSSLFLCENLSKHDNVSRSIFSPPPNFS